MENRYANIGMAVGGMLVVLLPAWKDLHDKADDAQTEQRAHWKAERLHKDSLDNVRWDSAFRILKGKK